MTYEQANSIKLSLERSNVQSVIVPIKFAPIGHCVEHVIRMEAVTHFGLLINGIVHTFRGL